MSEIRRFTETVWRSDEGLTLMIRADENGIQSGMIQEDLCARYGGTVHLSRDDLLELRSALTRMLDQEPT